MFLFWRAIEALTPQDIDKENARDKLNPVYKVGAGSMLPWDDPEHTRKDIAPGKVWRYSAQAGVYHLSVITKMLEDKIGAHEAVPEERKSGKCRLFDIGFSEEGIPSQPRSCYPCLHGRRLRYSGMIAAFTLFMLPFAPMCPTCPHQTTASRWWIAVFTILII